MAKWKKPRGAEREAHLRKLAVRCLKEISSEGHLDSKRPLGNSDVEGDVLELLGIKPIEEGREVESDVYCVEFSEEQVAYAAALWAAWPTWAAKALNRAAVP